VGAPPVLLTDLQPQDPKAKQIELDGFASTQVTLTHKHKGTLAFVLGKVPGVSNLTSDWGG
jgi:hypothetical protein